MPNTSHSGFVGALGVGAALINVFNPNGQGRA